MKYSRVWFSPVVLLALACGGPAAEPETPAVEPEVAETPAPVAPVEEKPAELTPEEKAKAEAAEKLAKDFVELEEQSKAEAARFTDELKAETKALSEASYFLTGQALDKILKGNHRFPGHAERDGARHPKQTLEFFGVQPTHTVLEVGPGGGWYTELLAPLLAKRGKLLVTNGDPNGPRTERGTYYAVRTHNTLQKSPELYGKVEVLTVNQREPALSAEGSVDVAVVIRGFHGWHGAGNTEAWLKQIHKALKPRGSLGIVAHRAKPDADPNESVKLGYLPEQFVIDAVQAAGFKLAKKSEVNANPKDTKDHPYGVWSLPPTLRGGEENKAKFVEIGESDRMTLLFTKQ